MDSLQDYDARRWEHARLSRDPRFDGHFFVGVLSTGIYCRPICHARTPHARNVRLFASAAAAESTGLRPCLLCRPERAPATRHPRPGLAAATLQLVGNRGTEFADVGALAGAVGVSARHLNRLFRKELGTTPAQVLRTHRLLCAKRLLHDTGLPIVDIAASAGFASLRTFNAAFRRAYGHSPRQVRGARTAAGLEHRFLLDYRPPYDWDAALDFLRARALDTVECIEGGVWVRRVLTASGSALLRVAADTGRDALRLGIAGAAPGELPGLIATVRRVFDLDADPDAIARRFAGDPLLAPRIARRPGLRVLTGLSPFEVAVRAVVGQQVSVAGARTVFNRIVERYGTRVADTAPAFGFPAPARLAAAALDDVGLTGSRARTLNRLACAVADGSVDLDPGRDSYRVGDGVGHGIGDRAGGRVRAELLALKGIGPWTADYVQMRGLADPDGFPAGDLGLQRASGLDAKALEQRAAGWRPWRAYGAALLWQVEGPSAGDREGCK